MNADGSEQCPANGSVKLEAKRGNWIKTGCCYLGIALLLFLLVAISIPGFIKVRTIRPKNSCINNLRQIDACKELWALDHKKSATDMATWEDLLGSGTKKYLGYMPECPARGTYTIGSLSVPPACSVLPHTLSIFGDIRGTNLNCQESLVLLQVVKNEWFLRNPKQGSPALKQLLVLIYQESERLYLSGPPAPPKLECEVGGTFIIGGAGEKPRCSIPGHTLR